jgi:protein-tyrosine phosphatase
MPRRILFVCAGNTCRSPLAEGIMRSRLAGESAVVESAGTSVRADAVKPDPRAARVAGAHGVALEPGRPRAFVSDDFGRFDRIVAVDRHVHEAVTRLARSEADRARVSLHEIPDPFAGDDAGYERTYEQAAALCERLAGDPR